MINTMINTMVQRDTFGIQYSVLCQVYRDFLENIHDDVLYTALGMSKKTIESLDGIQVLHICYGVENTRGKIWVSSANIDNIVNKCLDLVASTTEDLSPTEFYLDIPSISKNNPIAIAEITEIISSLMGTVWNIGNFMPLLLLEFPNEETTESKDISSMVLCSLNNFQYSHLQWHDAPFAFAIPSTTVAA